MRNKNVLFVYNGRIESDGKGGFFGNELNDQLVERYRYLGENVTFLLRERRIEEQDKEKLLTFKSNNFSVVLVPEFNNPLKYLINSRKITKIIAKAVSECDILVSRLPSTLGRIAIGVAKDMGKPYIAEAVGCPWDALWNHSFLGKLLAPYAFFKMRALIRESKFVIYVTNNFLQKRYPNPNCSAGISDVLLAEGRKPKISDRIERFQSFKLKDRPLVLGTAGGVDVRYKGHSLVFKAIQVLKEKGISIRYELIGKGNAQYLIALSKQLNIEDNIVFLGQIPHSEVFNWYEQVDIYVQPSKQEGLPRALVEAMSMGCVCIGTPAGGIPELIESDMIIKDFDPMRLASIILQMDSLQFERQSLDNYRNSKQFDYHILENKRKVFFDTFLESVQVFA